MKYISEERRDYLISLLLSIGASLVIGALIMLANGRNPILGYGALLKGAFGSNYKLANTLAKTSPLVLTGLATSIAFNAGISNIGGEGQLYLGAFAAALVGISLGPLPKVLAIGLAIVAGALVGGLYAYFPGKLKIKYGVDEVITTIMLNTVAILFTGYLVNNFFAASDAKMSGTDLIGQSFQMKKLVRLSTLNSSIFLVILITIRSYYLMMKTSRGYEFKMVGQNKVFADYGGINSKKSMIQAMVISGGLCGITGVFEVIGVHYRFLQNISPELAFDGMLVSLVVRNNPLGIILMGLFFGTMKTGSIYMESATGVPSELVEVIQSIIILFIAGESGFKNLYKNWKLNRETRREAEND